MPDVTITYGSSGFERVVGELSEIEKRGSAAKGWFAPMGTGATDASNVASGALGTLVSAIGAVGSSLGTVGEIVLKATGLFVGMAGAIATGATVALGAFGSQLLKTADNFYKLEVSMFGALKSWEKVATVSKFSMEYAAKYPAMYGDVMRAMSGFAFIPKTKDMLMQGDIVKMKELMNIVQGLMTMRPEFPVQFAIMALRNAMAGQMRSLEFRYDIPLEAIARAGKTTIGKMKGDADVFISAMTGFMNEFVGEKTMEMAAKNVGTQIGNVKDKYDQWMNTLSQTGPYQAVVDMLLRLNSFLDSLAKSPAIASFTFMLGDALKGIAQGLEGIFTKGIDWGKIGESGEGLGAAVKQIAVNATEAFLLVWKSIKEPLYATLLEAFRIAAGIISEVVSEIFYPIGKELVQGIIRGIREELRTNPIANVLFIGAGAAAGAKVAGGWGALAGGAGAAFASLANQVSGPGPATPKENTEAIIGRIVEKWTRAAEVTNLRPRNETLEEFGQRFYKERQAQAVKEGAIPPPKKPTIFSQGIEERLSEYGLWSKMGMSLTQAEAAKERGGGEPQNAGYLFATGKIKEDEYFARRKIEDFQDKQLSKLEGMARDLGGEKKTKERFETEGKIYGEMFNIALSKGDVGKANDMMNKALQAMQDQMKAEQGIFEEQERLAKESLSTQQTMSTTLLEIRDLQGQLIDKYTGSGVRETYTKTEEAGVPRYSNVAPDPVLQEFKAAYGD